jgi:organic hydroperoxide reductase OsmC/OhrA
MNGIHNYSLKVKWTGNKGDGTRDYRTYDRSHIIGVEGKPDIEGSSDTAFRGDKSKYNPEDMLVASLATCHMLWYLHICADAGVIVTGYADEATGTMTEDAINGGRFIEVTLHPVVTVADASMINLANELHAKAHKQCFIANSMNFPVYHEPVSKVVEKINA